MPDVAITITSPTLERVAVLEHLVHLALEDFDATEHGILWDALLDARAAFASARTVVTAVLMDAPVLTRPALVCSSCGGHLRPEDATDRRDYLFERDHHERGNCDKRSNGDGDE